MRYYIASGLENAARVRELKAILDANGWQHTYDWTVHGSAHGRGVELIREIAVKETMGVLSAEVVIALMPGGRGTHEEKGMAIASGKRVVLFSENPADFGDGKGTCCFYHHPFVEQVSTWADLLAALGVKEGA